MTAKTQPTDDLDDSTAPLLAVAATYKDPITGALYVHRDLALQAEPWAAEAHISPPRVEERFGDVESWVAYVKRFGVSPAVLPLLTWNKAGLRGVLDYHGSVGDPDRCQWLAISRFVTSPEWNAWIALANGQAVPQKRAIEALEDMAADIIDPAPTDLMNLLRSLRATVNATAATDLRPDGTTNVSFSQDKTLKAAGSVDLPPEFRIGIRVLMGHVTADGKPVLYQIPVRLRASVGDDAKLGLRFSIPTAERVLEAALEDRINHARVLLGADLPLLRAGD